MIEIRDMDFAYKHTQVLSNINLTFQEGHIYGLLGENGSGKTTLLKLISGLQKPLRGQVCVDGAISFDRKPSFLASLYFMPDEIALPDNTTPQSYIDSISPFYPHYSASMFRTLMETLELDPLRKFREMSYGQQKKSLIACALSLNTSYLLLDEPTNGMDIPSKVDFRKILSQRMNDKTTIIISTHQVKDVENLIDPIVILANNGVLLNATMEQIARRLFFEYSTTQRSDALYSEMQPNGWLNVVENTTGEESAVNIEALFNTILKTKYRI